MTGKSCRIRVRVLDGKPRTKQDLNRLKSNVLKMAHLDIFDAKGGVELILCAPQEKHLADVRAKLRDAGLEEIERGDTTTPTPPPATPAPQGVRQGGSQQRHQVQGVWQQPNSAQRPPEEAPPDLSKKPYGFVPLPETFTTAEPIWHDGTSSNGKLSGEIRCELETLTPLLVGWERGNVGDGEADWPVPANLNGVGQLVDEKPVLCPLRAPWGERPVIIPGDTLKGLLRHELGALLGAPLERVAERSYSYRPNTLFPQDPNPFLIARLARVPQGGVAMQALGVGGLNVRVPIKLELLQDNLAYDRHHTKKANYYRFDNGGGGAPYRGGLGAGMRLNKMRNLHNRLTTNPNTTVKTVNVPDKVQQGYLATLRHLIDPDHGHFSSRYPDNPNMVACDQARERILTAAQCVVFQPGDMIWVEWDTNKECIVSLGWHYYYRWAYIDTVRKKGGTSERRGLFALDEERKPDGDGAPEKLSPVRRLFGYTGDNEGSAGIGQEEHTQLMGRISINAGLEVINPGDTDEQRFLGPTFLKELGIPRPSAVEFYLKQPHHPAMRPSDQATLMTYGDAAGYDDPGELAGRKFYMDREDTYTGEPWKDASNADRSNKRSTLALEASCPERLFRFTLRFRDLEPAELAAVLVALCPHQFHGLLGGEHPDGYCSKLGYARPLGWGSVRIEAKALLLLGSTNSKTVLQDQGDLITWTKNYYASYPMRQEWLNIHRHKHPDARDYPRDGNGNIYAFHSHIRARHSRSRRYRNHKGGKP